MPRKMIFIDLMKDIGRKKKFFLKVDEIQSRIAQGSVQIGRKTRQCDVGNCLYKIRNPECSLKVRM